jgi:hypothetical protein
MKMVSQSKNCYLMWDRSIGISLFLEVLVAHLHMSQLQNNVHLWRSLCLGKQHAPVTLAKTLLAQDTATGNCIVMTHRQYQLLKVRKVPRHHRLQDIHAGLHNFWISLYSIMLQSNKHCFLLLPWSKSLLIYNGYNLERKHVYLCACKTGLINSSVLSHLPCDDEILIYVISCNLPVFQVATFIWQLLFQSLIKEEWLHGNQK